MKKKRFLLMPFFWMLASCASMSSFESPNNLRNIEGTVFLSNGKAVDGKLVVQTGSLFGSDVKVYSEGDKKPMHFNLSEVEGFTVNNQHYVLKEKQGGFGPGSSYSFMKRLTPEGSRIHLYEAIERVPDSGKATGSTNSRARYEMEYYIQIPGEGPGYVHPLAGSKAVSNLDEKLGKMISDCPALSKKFGDKESGYDLAQLSSAKEKRAEALLNIIHEYNSCN